MGSRSGGSHVDGWGVGWPAPPPPNLPESLLETALRFLAGLWLELLTVGAVTGGLVEAHDAGLEWAAVAGVVGLLAATVAVGPLRRAVRRVLHGQRVRRQWRTATRVAAVAEFRGQVPAVLSVRAVPAGDVLTIRVPPGATAADLENSGEIFAAALQLRDVRVVRDPANARHAAVTLIRRDPLAVKAPPWPHTDAESLSLWDPVPVGVDEAGEQVTISLPERNVLLGGEPGAGKSAALSLLVATAALDPSVVLHLFDGKLVELATWAGVAEHNVGVSTAEANDVLRQLQSVMDSRYLTLLANRVRKVAAGDGLALHVLVVDELAHYLLASDRKERAEFAELLRDLVARGRAAGLIVLAATQKPAHDIIPTALRDLFGFRWALRCNTAQASDTVLGSGWASLGYSAADIDAGQRGVGYLRHEGGEPIRCRSHYLDDDVLAALALRAERLRHPDRFPIDRNDGGRP